MYAVFASGGKQHRVKKDQVLKVEYLDIDAGDTLTIDEVMMVGEGEQVAIGAPFVAGASIKFEVLEHGRGDKIKVIKFKRRKKYRRTQGHRQNYTALKVVEINAA